MSWHHLNMVTGLGWDIYPFSGVMHSRHADAPREATRFVVESAFERTECMKQDPEAYAATESLVPLEFRKLVEDGALGEIHEFRLILFAEHLSRGACSMPAHTSTAS
jgi:hypothetical protein